MTSKPTNTATSKTSSKRYLEKHGKQWRVQVRVPPKLQSVMGKKKLVVPLHTSSLAEANLLKWDIVARLKAEIKAAERGVALDPDTLTEEAMRWRDAILTEEPPVRTFVDEKTGEVIEYDDPVAPDLARDRAEEIENEKGRDAALTFYKIAIGQATPITALINPWLAERKDIKPRQHRDYRRAVEKFHAWSEKPVEEVTRKLAGLYISEAFISKAVNPKTANKDISCLSSFWRWLVKRGHAESNPWEGQSLSKKLMPKPTKRAYTDEEMMKLLRSTNDTLLLDLMKVAALSGMRREEIMLLRVNDTYGGMFNIRDAKTEAGIRKVPIHSQLTEIIARLTKDRSDDAFLFDVTGREGGVVERGDYIGKRFNAYRKRIGLDERKEGQRQSNIDFHSLRRWFIATARNALQQGAKGYDPWTIAEVVGHDNKSPDSELQMTMGVYSGPQTEDAKRACVNAVKLPVW